MPVFRPPFRNVTPLFSDDAPLPERMLLRHYRPGPVGITVYVLNDDTVTQTKPTDESLIKATYLDGYVHTITVEEALVLIYAGYAVEDMPSTAPNTWAEIEAVTWSELETYTWEQLESA